FDRLVNLARQRLRSARRPNVAEDEEDAALSAFDSFCRGASRGRFPRLTDRDDLWRLLVVLTVPNALRPIARHSSHTRGGGRPALGSDVPGPGDEGDNVLDQLIGREPTPEFAAMIAEQYRQLRDELGDESLRQVLDLRLEGHTREEIASRMGCAVRTVT